MAMAMVLGGTSPAGGDGDHPGCDEGLEQTSHAFDQAFVERDFDTFMSFIADDAVQVDFLGNVYDGKEAIAAFTRAVMANEYTFSHSLIAQTIRPCSSATVLQDTVFGIPTRSVSVRLLDAVNWARVDGEWQVVMIQNTEIPEGSG
jgi:uncharacterized protein (TIGR02246 family)